MWVSRFSSGDEVNKNWIGSYETLKFCCGESKPYTKLYSEFIFGSLNMPSKNEKIDCIYVPSHKPQ